MSIIAYTGLPGSGKTLSVVENVILPALKAGRVVVTNVPLVKAEVAKRNYPGTLDDFGVDAVLGDPARIFDYAIPGAIIVIDESWRLFPAGLKANKVPTEFKSWLAEHRHKVDALGNAMQIVFVTQDLAQIAAFARQLVEQTFVIKKMSSLGLDRQYRTDVYDGAVSGSKPPVSHRLRYFVSSYNKEVFPLYRSHTQSESNGTGANERSVDRRFIVWKSPKWMLGAPLVVGFGVWSVYSAVSWFSERSAPRASAATAPAQTVARPRAVDSPARAVSPAIQPEYRVVGYIEGREGKAQAAIDAAGVLVFIPFSDCYRPGDGLTHCAFNGRKVTELGATF